MNSIGTVKSESKEKKVPETIDTYISGFPLSTKDALVRLRDTIRNAAPEAEEKISYQMPLFKQKGVVAYFAAHTNHIGFYPGPSAIKAFEKELADYYTSKGTIHFPFDKPLPLKLIDRMIKFKVKENLMKDSLKKNKRKK